MFQIKQLKLVLRLLAAPVAVVAISLLPIQYAAAQTEDCARAGLTKRAIEACEERNRKAKAEREEPAFGRTDCKVPWDQINNNDFRDDNDCGIIRYLLIFINVLSALVGIVVVIMIIIGGIQYSTAADNPQAAIEAKKRIANAILALILYTFTFSFLQWVVPGGLF
jgi:hypothetical protein